MSSKEFRGAESKINACMWGFADFVVRSRPQIAVFESVQQAFTKADGLDLMRRLRAHVEERTGEKWELFHIRHNAYSVGGAAQRRRYFWLISRIPFGIEPPVPTCLPVLNDVIGDLASLPLTWQAQPYRAPMHPWTENLRNPLGAVDGHMNLNNPLIRRLYDLMRAVPWNPGESMATVIRRYYETHGRLPDSWMPYQEKILARQFLLGFTTPTRWNGENHARVITGGSLQMVIHPWLNRMITHREAARILGFPDNWNILPLRGTAGLHLTWGKGISVQCGRWIAEWIRSALDGSPGSYTGEPLGESEWDVDVTHAWKSGRDPLNIRLPVVVQ